MVVAPIVRRSPAVTVGFTNLASRQPVFIHTTATIANIFRAQYALNIDGIVTIIAALLINSLIVRLLLIFRAYYAIIILAMFLARTWKTVKGKRYESWVLKAGIWDKAHKRYKQVHRAYVGKSRSIKLDKALAICQKLGITL